MTRHGPALLALSVLAIAGWTYGVNYDTRAALDRLGELRARIVEEREALQVLRVEWAYLNAPDRLTRLVAEHEETLALAPLRPEALGYVAAVPYPRGRPVEPVPGPAPEALIAAAPGAAQGGPPVLAAAPADPGENSGSAAPAIGASRWEGGIDTAALEPAGEPGSAAVGTLQGDAGPAIAAAARAAGIEAAAPADPVVTAAAQKAVVMTAAPEPATMQDAVTLALIEAGIVEPGAAPAAVIAASAQAGIPVPPARPASWSRP